MRRLIVCLYRYSLADFATREVRTYVRGRGNRTAV
jgi:hypothetical protein